ncbi:30S ribosomal protein S16 [Patescibacteria group bacterium]|nr:30S ribosomal protein S16 [Patescibacteria group bacterium]
MLMIRLQRIGKKKSPSYRLIVSEKHKNTQAGSLEILGQYDPTKDTKIVNLKEDKIKHWLSVGAQPSETVNNLLINAGVITGKKQKSVAISKKRSAKLDGKKAEVADAKTKAEDAKVKAETPIEETPAEEPKDEETGNEKLETAGDPEPVDEKVIEDSATPVEEKVKEETGNEKLETTGDTEVKEEVAVEEAPKEEKKEE